MADKEEVEPTEESSSAASSDAADQVDPTVDEPTDEVIEGDVVDDEEPDRFDEIVRDSGIGESDAQPDGDADSDSEKALEPAGVGAAAAGASGAVARTSSTARKSKDAATRRRDQPVKTERTGPVKFVKESVGELRKVVYPTGQQLINYFVVVLVFVLFVIGYVSLLDLGLGTAIFKIFS
ncbi:MAG TPA: preprotein translocase subunit SecE [Propionibacteriaceae bacterium]